MDNDHSGKNRWLLFGTVAAYLLIGLEVLFMITPFALYFYGVYGPILEFLSARPATAWTVEFFLPHMVFVDDPLLIGLSYLQVLFVIGLVLFLANAIPLYYGRLTGKGVVSGGLYGAIRHPQYLFLAISGFGLLLYWPRFIVLIFFVTMLFVYYLLARNEEWRMRREQPGSYEAYMARTAMFLPGEPGGAIFRRTFGRIGSRGVGIAACYLVVLALSIFAALGLRTYTVDQLPKTAADGMTLVSVYPRPAAEMREIYHQALASDAVRQAVADEELHLAYLMPGDFFLTGLVLREGPRFSPQQLERFPKLKEQAEGHRGGLVKFFRLGYKFFRTIGTTRRVYDVERLLLVRTLGPGGRPVAAEEVMEVGVQRLPSMVVDLDSETGEVIVVTSASGENAWGRLPMPGF